MVTAPDRSAGLWTRCRPDWLTFIVLTALALAFFARARFPPDYRGEDVPSAAQSTVGDPNVQDFAFHFNYARRAAARSGVSPYSVDEHRRFIRAWLGPRVGSALCFAYSPTLILVLAPLFVLPTAWAWLAWNVGSAWLAAWVVRRGAGTDRTLLSLGRIGLISPNALHCLALGQTALFTTGALAAMLLWTRSGGGRAAVWWCAVSAFVLTMKPPLALVAGVALLAAGCWSPLLWASVAALAVLAAAIGWWGPQVMGDYLTLLARYNLVEADPVFRAGFVPGLMSNLRNVLLHTGAFDDARASSLSRLVFAVTLLVPAVLALLSRRRWRFEDAVAWTAVGYALFAPHLSSTEDLILVVVLLALWRSPALPRHLRLPCALLCLVPQFVGGSTAIVLGSGVEGATARVLPLVSFAAKLALGCLLTVTLLQAAERPRP